MTSACPIYSRGSPVKLAAREARTSGQIFIGSKKPAERRFSGGGVNIRSSVGDARKYCGLYSDGSCGLRAKMTNAPINTAKPIATRDKKNLGIYSGCLSSLLFSQAMCDLIGSSSASSTRSHVGHSNVRRTDPAGPGSIRASIMGSLAPAAAWSLDWDARRLDGTKHGDAPGLGGDEPSLFQAAASLCSLVYTRL